MACEDAKVDGECPIVSRNKRAALRSISRQHKGNKKAWTALPNASTLALYGDHQFTTHLSMMQHKGHRWQCLC